VSKNWEQIRREYHIELPPLDSLPKNPIGMFEQWFQQALDQEIVDANAMTLSTVDSSFNVSSRIVLLKKVVNNEIYFYTNYKSTKFKNIEEQENVSLCFYWKELCRQVNISGVARKGPRKESEEYFYSRPKDSQISAIISNQSHAYFERSELEKKFNDLKNSNQELTCPDYWGSVIVEINAIEFWQGRESRLHDRMKAYCEQDSWRWELLAP
jgi:pyridoxamine 5'-phosphate oxidase